MGHLPVMLDEIMFYLGSIKAGVIIDGTLGMGGHTESILKGTPDSVTVVGIDRDATAVSEATKRLATFGSRFLAIHGSYHEHKEWADKLPDCPVNGFLLDLGLSSVQLDNGGRGFSFNDPISLDMRFDQSLKTATAGDLVNTLPEEELADLIYRYGEEKASRRIARAIVRRRETRHFETARDLAETIANAYYNSTPLHPATRTFQALRIAVNSELSYLEKGLMSAEALLNHGGVLAVISYHSLEDRLVKQFLIERSGKCKCPKGLPVCKCNSRAIFHRLNRKPEVPKSDEVKINPRSRSAKLRCAERIREEGVAA